MFPTGKRVVSTGFDAHANDFPLGAPGRLGKKCNVGACDLRIWWCLLVGLIALLPSPCDGSHTRGSLLFNGTLGVGDCDLDESAAPASEGTVIHDCVFVAIVRKCSRKKLSDPGLVFEGCRGRICENDLSISTTGCILDSMGLNYTEGLENDEYKCGIPLVNKDWFEVKEITWVDSIPGSRRCALRIPHGSKIEQNIICIRGFARLRFTLMLGEKLTPGRYSCELNPRCNSFLGIYGDSVCHEEGGGHGEELVSVENGGGGGGGGGDGVVGSFMVPGFAEKWKLGLHSVAIALTILFLYF